MPGSGTLQVPGSGTFEIVPNSGTVISYLLPDLLLVVLIQPFSPRELIELDIRETEYPHLSATCARLGQQRFVVLFRNVSSANSTLVSIRVSR